MAEQKKIDEKSSKEIIDALQTLQSLIEQVMGSGGFKKLADLDLCRDALKLITEKLVPES
jgi:hypothetical protein